MAKTYSPYSIGTVTATNGLAVVTGSGTTWTDSNACAGGVIKIANVAYTILTRDSATQLTLTTNYAETGGSGKAYIIDYLLNPEALTAAETVTINNGMVVEITNGTWGAAGAGLITVTWGELILRNTSTTTGFKLSRSSSIDFATIQGKGKITGDGDWISIGTGSGASGQTFSSWDLTGEFIPCVWIETASGSGVYEKYLNLTGFQAVHTAMDLSQVGAGKYGKFFIQHGPGTVSITNGNPTVTGSGTTFTTDLTVGNGITIGTTRYTIQSIDSDTQVTLTTNAAQTISAQQYKSNKIYFGNGTNGKCPPSGANVRVPNIILTYGAAMDANYCLLTRSIGGGVISLDTIQLSRVGFLFYQWQGFSINRCSFGETSTGAMSSAEFIDCGFAPFKSQAVTPFSVGTAAVDSSITLENCAAWTSGTSNPPVAIGSRVPLITITDCELTNIRPLANTTAIHYSISSVAYTSKLVVRGGFFVGQMRLGGVFNVRDFELTENLRLIEENTSTTNYMIKADNVDVFTGVIDNVYVPNGGASYADFLYSSGDCQDFTVSNIEIDSTGRLNSAYQFGAGGASPNVKLSGWDMNAFRTGFFTGSAPPKGGSATNLKSSTIASLSTAFPWSKILCKKVYASLDTAPTSLVREDCQFHDLRSSATDGALVHYFNTVNEITTISTTGTAVLDGSGSLFLPSVGDSMIMEFPFRIKGVSSFKNSAPTVAAVGSGNLLIEYAIDTGSGYGAWKTASGANLSGETVDASDGFAFKTRITCVTAGVTNAISRISILTNCDDSVIYYSSSVPVQLDNIVVGSRYYIYETLSGAELSSGTATDSMVLLPNTPYSSDVAVTISVRLAGYDPFDTAGTITALGMTTWISQNEDPEYNPLYA